MSLSDENRTSFVSSISLHVNPIILLKSLIIHCCGTSKHIFLSYPDGKILVLNILHLFLQCRAEPEKIYATADYKLISWQYTESGHHAKKMQNGTQCHRI